MNAASRPTLAPQTDPAKVDKILTAIGAITEEQLRGLGSWSPLEEISSATLFDGMEGSPSGVFQVEGDKFVVSATAYVTLQYGDDVSMSDSYPAIVQGHLDELGNAKIDSVNIDNSSFYE